jgi:hypothetical protein
MGRRLVACGAALASAGVALAWAGDASAVTFAQTCAPDPGPIAPSITNDAAIEVHRLRRELAQDCEALLERGDGLADRLELAWVGIWFLGGVLVVSLFAPAFFRAWRFWSE